MINTKAIVLLIAASVLVAAVAGIAFAQYVGSQTNGTITSQTPQGTTGSTGATYLYPQQGYNLYQHNMVIHSVMKEVWACAVASGELATNNPLVFFA